jgi:integrase
MGCGLRREELVFLNVEDVQLRDDRWVIPHLVGKGKRVRLVPVPGWVKERLDEWTTKGEIRERRIFRSMRKNEMVSGESLSAAAVWKIVLYYARRTAGIRELSPHDLRSYAVGRIMPNWPRYACWIADSTALRLSIVINKVFVPIQVDLIAVMQFLERCLKAGQAPGSGPGTAPVILDGAPFLRQAGGRL